MCKALFHLLYTITILSHIWSDDTLGIVKVMDVVTGLYILLFLLTIAMYCLSRIENQSD